MKVSVIIPAYNAEPYIAQAIESCQQQTAPPDEIIVADDGSTDRTAEIAESYPEPVRVLRLGKNCGLSMARNRAVEASTGDWLAFLDADDWFFPRKLESQRRCIAENPRAVLVYCGVRLRFIDGSEQDARIVPPHELGWWFRYGCAIPTTSSVMIRRDAFEAMGKFSLTFRSCQDWDLWLKVADRYSAAGFASVPESLVMYRRVAGSLSSNKVRIFKEEITPIISSRSLYRTSGLNRFLLYRRILAFHYSDLAITLREEGSDSYLEYMLKSLGFWPFPFPPKILTMKRYKSAAVMLMQYFRWWPNPFRTTPARWGIRTQRKKDEAGPMHLPRHAEIWFAPYLKDRVRRAVSPVTPKRAWVTVADHYEPLGRRPSLDRALEKVAEWRDKWPRIAEDAPRDAAGRRPQYTFFYPQEEYRSDLLEGVAGIARLGVADVEVHLHHDNERRETFIQKVTEFCRRLTGDHGLLRQHNGRTAFGFIHGNWALDNSRPDGKHCGLNGEIALLRDLGCYADFTMPSLPSPTQGRVVNQVYWCTSNADGSPRSFDRGIEATLGGGRQGDLLMITGPLGVRFGKRSMPRLETGEIAGYDLPTPKRVRRWFDLAPMIGSDMFLKLYTHGADDWNIDVLLDRGLADLYRLLAEEAERRGIEIHWATAWQMYQAIEALTQPLSSSSHA